MTTFSIPSPEHLFLLPWHKANVYQNANVFTVFPRRKVKNDWQILQW